MANRTTLVDNNTWNNSHIALVGKAMSSNESAAYEIMTALDVDYVLVIFGGVIGYSGDDINKFLWMVRIAEGEHPKDIRVSQKIKNKIYIYIEVNIVNHLVVVQWSEKYFTFSINVLCLISQRFVSFCRRVIISLNTANSAWTPKVHPHCWIVWCISWATIVSGNSN